MNNNTQQIYTKKILYTYNNFFIFSIEKIKKKRPYGQSMLTSIWWMRQWSRWRESNSRSNLGKVVFYHWTTSAFPSAYIIYHFIFY